MKKILRIIIFIIGLLLCLDTAFLLIYTISRSAGIFLPGIIGLPLLVYGIFFDYINNIANKNKVVNVLRSVVMIGYIAFSVLFFVTSVICFSYGHKEAKSGADVLIVLGCGIKGDRPSLTLIKRLDRAYEYLVNNEETTVIVSGGQGKSESVSEAFAMKKYLVSKGIAENRIIMEDKSASTEENFANSLNIIEENFGENADIVFVTTRFHVFRAGKVAQAKGMNVQGMGSDGVWYITFNDYMRECIAISAYFVLGRL